ncbi:MAG: nucleotide exchange factor GrpE [Anaerolineales bacterium]|nr:nucleotide exchange factor GrpE [Anaerolineales bacterium]
MKEDDRSMENTPEELSPEDPSQEADQAAAVVEAPESLEELHARLTELQEKADEYLDGWQRARAEFANYKKRVERDQAQVYQSAVGSIAKRYLEVLDDLELALKNRPQSGDGAEWAAGIELIYRKLLNFLEAEGVIQMQADGQAFDPNLHEAISSDETDGIPAGQIIEVLRQGYLLGERVLRPATVRVAR